MRRGGVGKGIFSGDYNPPLPWRFFNIRIKNSSKSTDRSIGALTDAELHWVARVVLAESQSRTKKKALEEAMIPVTATNA